jgi:arsenate reductase
MTSIQEKQQQIIDDFALLGAWDEKYAYLIELGQAMPEMPSELKTEANLVRGCQSNVWFHSTCQDGIFHLDADSDAMIVKGIAALLVNIFSDQPASEVREADLSFIDTIGMWKNLSSSRNNGLMSMLEHLRKAAKECAEQESTAKHQVLFLCTGNSCRSQLAEAIVNARLGDRWQAFSAGTKPAGYVHPKALQVLSEIGITHAGTSKSVDTFKDHPFDLVITMCDSAAEDCPLWLGQGRRLHCGFPDPVLTDDINDFRKVRDDIAQQIPPLLNDFLAGHPGGKPA